MKEILREIEEGANLASKVTTPCWKNAARSALSPLGPAFICTHSTHERKQHDKLSQKQP